MALTLVVCGAGADPQGSAEFAYGLTRLQRQTGPIAQWHWAANAENNADGNAGAAKLLTTALQAGQGRPDSERVLLLAHAQLLMAGGTLEQLQAALLPTELDMALCFGPQHLPDACPPDYCTLRGLERYTQLMAKLPAEPAQTLSALPTDSLVCLTHLGALRRLSAGGQFRAQWQPGCFSHDFSNYHQGHQGRSEMVPWVPTTAQRVLDVGGGEGYFLHALRLQHQCETHLAEFSASACEAARPYVDHVWQGDFLTQPFNGLSHQGQAAFDCISFLDVLEHAAQPQDWLQRAKTLLTPEGVVVASIPNVGHWGVVADLLEGRWDYCPVGIHCVTHLRFFTERTMQALFAEAGYVIEQCERVQVPCPPQWREHWAQTPGLDVQAESWDTYAFLVRARPVATVATAPITTLPAEPRQAATINPVDDTCAILVNYFGADDSAAAVQSVRADVPGLPIVVVDNSDDATEHLKLQQLLPQDINLQVLLAPGNIGFGRGCNLAAEATSASHLLLVNPDVLLLPGCVQSLRQALENDAALAAVAPRQFLDTACQWQLPPSWFPTALRAWATERAQRDAHAALRVAKAARAENLRYWTSPSPLHQRALSGAVVMLRRSAMPTNGPEQSLFDPRFFMYFEDSDLCMRLRQQNVHMAVVPQAQAIHAWRNLPHKGAMMAEGAEIYFNKHYPNDQRWLHKARTMSTPPLPHAARPWQTGRSTLAVPAQWQTRWVLELSPSPLIQPALGMVGSGPQADIAAEALSCFEGAAVYGRLGGIAAPVGACQLFYWPANK